MKRSLGGGLAAVVAMLGALAPAAAAQSRPGPSGTAIVRLAGMQPPSPALYGARAEGAAATTTKTDLTVYLASPRQAQLTSLANAVSTPGSASYHHFLTVAQFRAAFSPPAATIDALDAYLRGYGLKVGSLAPNGLSQSLSGSVHQVDAALHTSLVTVRTRAGKDVVGSTGAPGLPASVASSVSYIDGLTPWIRPHDNLNANPASVQRSGGISSLRPAGSAGTGSAAVSECSQLAQLGSATDPAGYQWMDPSDVSKADALSGFYSKADTGQGKTIGLIEYDSYDAAAVSAWESCINVTPKIDTEIDPTYPPPSTPQYIEATADIELVTALAPAATIAVYEANNATAPPLDPWTEAITGANSSAPLPAVISTSWASCEPVTGPTAYFQAEVALFAEAALQGQTIVAASGDQGSEGCYGVSGAGLTTAQQDTLAVNDPASDPLVTAVGGTGSDTVSGPQYPWNQTTATSTNCLGSGCPGGATGGGLSTVWDQPAYQPPDPTLQAGCTNTGGGGCREVPDVSALAGDPYAMMCSGSVGGCPGTSVGAEYFSEVTGTSLAAPSWAATVALADVGCGGNVGFLDELLYQDAGDGHSVVGAVTSGNNDFTATNGGDYPAYASGAQNLATGLGYLGGVDLSTGGLCRAYSPPPAAAAYTPLTPTRICDTRTGNPSQLSGMADQCDSAGLKAGNRLEISVGANFAVPATATAVVLNVTAVDPAATGYVTVYPSGEVPPTASNLNYRPGQVVANLVEVGLGTLGDVTLFTSQATDLVVDLEGYVDPGSGQGYHPLGAPVRVCDTRSGNPSDLTGAATQCNGHTLAAGATLAVAVTGSSFGVPSGATAVVLNLTAVHPAAQGYLTAYPDGVVARPTASNVNYVSGVVVPNRVIVPVGADGAVEVYSSASTDVIVDLAGYYQGTGSQYTPLAAPVRICDTRTGNPSGLSGLAAQCNGNPLGPDSVRSVSVEGFGAPSTATAVVLNVTAVAPTQNTYLTVFPGGTPPTTSDLNPAAGATESNLVVATVGSGGVVDIYNLAGSTNVVFDLEGWYQ